MGDIEQSIAKQAVMAGNKIPEKILNAPQVNTGLELYFNAFFELESERQIGMSIGPIPWSSINEYSKVYNLSTEQKECLFYFVRKLDRVYLRKVNNDNSSSTSK